MQITLSLHADFSDRIMPAERSMRRFFNGRKGAAQESGLDTVAIDSRLGAPLGNELMRKKCPSRLQDVEPQDSIRCHFCDRIVPVRPSRMLKNDSQSTR